MTASRWWPFHLDQAEQEAVASFLSRQEASPQTLDLAAAGGAVELLDAQMALIVTDIVDRDGLPHLAHLINGWGDAALPDGTHLVGGLAAFVHHASEGRGLMLQKHPEGEVHPWQSLAYAFMAGAESNMQLGHGGWTIRQVAEASRWLNTTDGEELGHLLYALARLGPRAATTSFTLGDGSEANLERLTALAVEAHVGGHFEVCRKVHLTEGLCAAVAVFPELVSLRGVVEKFLAGQVDSLLILGALLAELGPGVTPAPDRNLVAAFQQTLALDDYFENQYYWAGHVLELAGLAAIDGYQITDRQRQTMIFVANELNGLLPSILPSTWFPGSFLHFGHYRRGLTLLMASEEARTENRVLTAAVLGQYAADLSGPRDAPEPSVSSLPGNGLFRVAPAEPGPEGRFAAVLEAYASVARPGFEARGGYSHFRRVIPPGWPRALHYELLEGDDDLGVELHFESETVKPLASTVVMLVESGGLSGFDGTVVWDPEWYGGRGRLRLVLDPDLPPSIIAGCLDQLIDVTHGMLDGSAQALQTPSTPAELVG